MDADAMQAGSRLHRKIQKSMGSNYTAEVPLSIELPLSDGEESFLLVVEGRADGVIRNQDDSFIIDEIKCTYRDVKSFTQAEQVHLAQARCYAYMLGVKEGRLGETAPGADEAEMKKAIQEKINEMNGQNPVYKRIASWELRKEPFEKTSSLKIRRNKSHV